MTNPSVHHDTFVIERTYPVAPARVFRALTDPEAKAQWFLAPAPWKSSDYRLDCRVGGTEHAESREPNGRAHIYDATYHEVVPDRRVVFSYDMRLGSELVSVSLTTIEVAPVQGGTSLTFTEQGAFIGGDPAGAASRVEGTEYLLDNLGKALAGLAG
ncbi:MAG TPA: SRPBCC family protein [Acidimicrobiales bacterium]|nr:SRPBCC family protein [Acidimicrobiales bacterium]